MLIEKTIKVNKTGEPRRLYQQVADQIRHLIQAKEYGVGTRLPSERDLAQELGVSRPSLREALIALEIEGTVEIRGGSGVYISAERFPNFEATRPMGESPSELMQARAVIEGTAVLMAVSRMTSQTIDFLHETQDLMAQEIAAGRSPLAYDRQFHLSIAAESGNSVLERIITELFDERHNPIAEKLQDRFDTSDTWRLALLEHQAILGALESRDPLQAQAEMRIHIEASRRRWIETLVV